MIVVRVELWSAISGRKTELARMIIGNADNAVRTRRNYVGSVLRGRSTEALDRNQVHRQGTVTDWPSEAVHVWNLVAAMLAGMGYGAKRG